jgi:tricorn protease
MLAGNFRNLNYVNGKLYFVESRRGQSSKFKYYDLNEKKEQEIGDYWNYQISADRKNVLVYNNGNWYISNLPTGSLSLKESVSFSDLKINIDLKAEWQQIYFEAWRQMRDFLYDPNLHQVDWEKQKNKYAELLPYVNSRNDLNYIIGELIGELNVGHAYVGGGDRKEIQRIKTGLLGAEFEKDKSGYFKITKIYQGENWRNNLTSPLTGIGLDINENDYITSINGQDLKEVDNIFSVLIDQADKMIEIEVSTSSNGKNAKKYFVKPISDEADLIYFNWVRENIRKVNEATDGKVGYIHVPDMSVAGLNEFMKYYYPQLSKQALIIDDRGNGGGNVSPMLIERLRRELSIMGMQRDVPLTNMKPRGMLFGPKVLLLDNYSASDGDLFPYQFKRHELGVTVGQRSWGGVVGIRGSLPFIDGATLSKPEFAHFDENGWIIEGYGVDPDVVVENDPYQEFLGNDQQLNEAIKIILQEIEKFGKTKPAIPDFPDKSK